MKKIINTSGAALIALTLAMPAMAQEAGGYNYGDDVTYGNAPAASTATDARRLEGKTLAQGYGGGYGQQGGGYGQQGGGYGGGYGQQGSTAGQGVKSSGRMKVTPYIEVSQFASLQLSPGNDTVTYTNVAAGVDTSLNGRNVGGTVSVRYEYNIGYGSNAPDSDSLSGVVRGFVSVIPQVLNFEVGGVATRTSVDAASGASSLNVLPTAASSSNVYSAYAGPTLQTRVGPMAAKASYQIGYSRVGTSQGLIDQSSENPMDIFDSSITQTAAAGLSVKAGELLPVGLSVSGELKQEDVANLDQRIRDAHLRADLTVPIQQNLALVAGVGYESVKVAARDAIVSSSIISGTSTPERDDKGRFITDKSQDRKIAFQSDGLIWDAGVQWRPNSRASLEARYGRRYDSETYYGSFAYAMTNRSSVNVNVYDEIGGFGSQLNNVIASLPTAFVTQRDPLTGQMGGCVTGAKGGQCLNTALASVNSSAFRSRGIGGGFSTTIGRFTAGFGLGYDRRTYLAAADTVLESTNGAVDETMHGNIYLSAPVGRSGTFQTNARLMRQTSDVNGATKMTTYGASAGYNHNITPRFSMRASIALDKIDSTLVLGDQTTASGLLGLRYGF